MVIVTFWILYKPEWQARANITILPGISSAIFPLRSWENYKGEQLIWDQLNEITVQSCTSSKYNNHRSKIFILIAGITYGWTLYR